AVPKRGQTRWNFVETIDENLQERTEGTESHATCVNASRAGSSELVFEVIGRFQNLFQALVQLIVKVCLRHAADVAQRSEERQRNIDDLAATIAAVSKKFVHIRLDGFAELVVLDLRGGIGAGRKPSRVCFDQFGKSLDS